MSNQVSLNINTEFASTLLKLVAFQYLFHMPLFLYG